MAADCCVFKFLQLRSEEGAEYFRTLVDIPPGGWGGTPYNGLYGEAPPKRGTLFRLQVYKRVGISQGLGTLKGREIGHLGI